MYTFEGLLSQVSGESDGWPITYHWKFELAFFPARCSVVISDMGNERAWLLDNYFLDFRPASDPKHIQVPEAKKWLSNLSCEITGSLKLTRPVEFPGISDRITSTMDLPRYPGFLTAEWQEISFCRVTTRAPPSQGHW